jgi:NAD(P)H dehydrogenase (quinone)
MTTYAVTGASGPFGRHVLETLVSTGVPATDLVAVARTLRKVADLADRGISVREADYELPDTLDPALAGVDVLLLVSGSEVGQRVRQHGNVVDAATRAGVRRIGYTSALRADRTPLVIAPEHKATEELIVASGIPYTLLRNGWYLENYTGQLASYVEHGAILHAAGRGRIAAATRADLAEAAAHALVDDRRDNVVYELGGAPFTYDELAAAVTEVTGATVVATELPPDRLRETLVSAGLDEGTAGFLVAVEANIADGALDTDSGDLARLLGRSPTSLVEALRAAH